MSAALQNLKISSRRSINHKIEQWADGDDEEGLAIEADAVAQIVRESRGFRWHSLSHQAAQDRALKYYRGIMTPVLRRNRTAGLNLNADRPDNANDYLLFPFDQTQLITNINQFLCIYIRSFAGGKKPRLSAATVMRTALWYWMTKADIPVTPNPPYRLEYYKRTNEVLQKLKKEGNFDRTVTQKTFLGGAELDELLEYDLLHTPNIEVHEQQAIAWLFGYLAGVRPGSLCPGFGKKSAMLWKHIRISRELTPDGDWNGRFVLDVHLANMKTDEDRADEDQDVTLDLVFGSPKYDANRSLPHRILILLLRRKYLKKHSTIESLMSGRENVIAIKPEALDQPVFLAATKRGLHLSDHQAGARSFSEYLKTRVLWMGWSGQITFYSWRRKFGTTIARALGPDQARRALGHTADSRVFEKHYDRGLYDLNVVNILVDKEDGRDKRSIENHVSLVLHRAELVRNCQRREKLLQDFIDEHEEVQAALRSGDMPLFNKIKRRVKKYALKALLDEEKALQAEELTVDTIKQRTTDLGKDRDFVNKIRKRAQELLMSEQDHTGAADDEDINDGRLEVEADFEDLDAVVESHTSNGVGPKGPLKVAKISPIEDTSREPATVHVFIAMMEILLNHQRLEPPNICEICVSNPLRTDKEREKVWTVVASLRRHETSDVHQPYGEWKCKADYLARVSESDSDKVFDCQYGCGLSWVNFRGLTEHIRDSNAREYGYEHDSRKQADGWYDKGFLPGWMANGDHVKSRKRKSQYTAEVGYNNGDDIDEGDKPFVTVDTRLWGQGVLKNTSAILKNKIALMTEEQLKPFDMASLKLHPHLQRDNSLSALQILQRYYSQFLSKKADGSDSAYSQLKRMRKEL